MRGALIIFLINYCTLFFSQQLTYSREFDTKRKLVPLQIINNQPNYFYVLRNNKLSHDLTIERRQKPGGEMLAFTPLKLDSVNADWFDYEKLEYLFFEHNYRGYFVFEKTINTRKAVYLKIIDTLGKSTGFIELAKLDWDASTVHFDFGMKAFGNRLLIVGIQSYFNKTSKKVAMLYDLEKRSHIWVKKLPLENEYTGSSTEFRINEENDLFYVSEYSHVTGMRRKFEGNAQVFYPIFYYDSLALLSIPHDSVKLRRKSVPLKNMYDIRSSRLHAEGKTVSLLANVILCDPSKCHSHFAVEAFDKDLGSMILSTVTPLRPELAEKLTFYDGTDFNSHAEKEYRLQDVTIRGGFAYYLAGRSEENYYKELLFWKIDLKTGEVLQSEVIPRKIFYFDDRTRFRNRGVAMQQVYNNTFYCFVAEDAGNLNKQPRDFKFHRFSKQKYLWDANLMAYILRPDGTFEKKLLHKNGRSDFVSLDYTSNQRDFIFYLNNGDKEQFATLKLDAF